MEEDQNEPQAIRRSRKGRSPSYPGISLVEAEKRVRELYAAEKGHAAPVTAISEHWGYSPTSSGGRTILAALKKFGLLQDEGSGNQRTGRLTDLGIELALNPEPQAVRRQAALNPRFHRQIWDEYGDNLPSAATLRYRLIREFGFTESGAEEFLDEYTATIEYAGLAHDPDPDPDLSQDPGYLPVAETQTHRTSQTSTPSLRSSSSPAVPGSGMTIPIPLLGEQPVYISGNFPLSEANWSQMMRVLEAMKPGLVEPGARPKTNLPPTASPEPRFSGEADGGVHPTDYAAGDE